MNTRILLAIALCAIGCDGQRAVIGGLVPYKVTTSSMEPTLKHGEDAFARPYREVPDPSRGELIVFKYPLHPDAVFAKRVVGVPGDTIQIVRKQLYVNGKPRNEPYVLHDDPVVYDTPGLPEPYKSRDTFGPFKVAPGQFFVLGDNRDRSSDSRYWGGVPRMNILGKVVSAGDPFGKLHPVR